MLFNLSRAEIQETNKMIEEQNLDVRTITLGISLLGCCDGDLKVFNHKVYDHITKTAENLVKTGDDIARQFGVPVVNKRISVSPIAIAAAGTNAESYVSVAETLDRAAAAVGVNFIGGFSALVHKGSTKSDIVLMNSIAEALSVTERVCGSINVGSTSSGINMNAVKEMGNIIKDMAYLTREQSSIACAKFVVFCNSVEDNPFMAGAYHGVGERGAVINVGVSGPGVVKLALEEVRGADFETLCETIKKQRLR